MIWGSIPHNRTLWDQKPFRMDARYHQGSIGYLHTKYHCLGRTPGPWFRVFALRIDSMNTGHFYSISGLGIHKDVKRYPTMTKTP